jgi:serine/threonine-protein kinase
MVPQTAGCPLNSPETLLATTPVDALPVPIVDEAGLIGGRYRILRPLGEGGMGAVYLADDLQQGGQAAIKTIRPQLADNAEVRARIRRERSLHASVVAHPNIVALRDTVEENGRFYLGLEYCPGETLARRLARGAPLTPGQSLHLIRQLLGALAAIHSRDIVHRDIKTANIILQPQTEGSPLVKLTDFGIARPEDDATLTQLTSLDTRGPGTPAYMAPERIDPQTFGALCAATDLYAAGIILYELLVGHPPFRGSMTEIFTGHLMQAPDLSLLPAGLPPGVQVVLTRALAKRSDARYPDAASFLAAVEAVERELAAAPASAGDATLLATGPLPPEVDGAFATLLDPIAPRRTSTSLRGRRWLAGLAALILLGLLGLAAHWLAGPSTPPTPVADTPAPAATEAVAASPATAEPAVAPGAPAAPAERDMTALQAVERSRQQTAPTDRAAERSERNPTPAQEWRVIDSQSRRLQ